MRQDLFKNPDFDPDRFERDMKTAPARRRYVIYFTPRSGSSWLSDVLTASKLMGKPHEWFNPNFIPNIARGVNADSLERYVDMLRRKHKRGNYFSTEITIFQLHRVFGDEATFVEYFPPDIPAFYLRREDMILQAVSLAKAVETSVFHTKNTTADMVDEADRAFSYDARAIGKWLTHILDQERRIEAYFARFGIRPHCLSYEQITSMGEEATLRQFMKHLRPRLYNAGKPKRFNFSPAHKKIGTSRNAEYAERFREEHPETLAELEEFRAQSRAAAEELSGHVTDDQAIEPQPQFSTKRDGKQ